MIVREIMSTKLCTAGAESSLADAATLMGENAVGSVMILDGERLAGILTERDIVRALSTAYDAPTRSVTEWMSREPITISPDAEITVALNVMLEGGFRHLPVVGDDGLVGALSLRDLAGHLKT